MTGAPELLFPTEANPAEKGPWAPSAFESRTIAKTLPPQPSGRSGPESSLSRNSEALRPPGTRSPPQNEPFRNRIPSRFTCAMLAGPRKCRPSHAPPTRKKRKTFCDRRFPPSPTKPVGISLPGSTSATGAPCAAIRLTQCSSTSGCAATWLAIIAMLNQVPNAQSDSQHRTANVSLNSSPPVLELKLLTSQAAPRNSTSTFVTSFDPHAISTSA